MIFGRRLILKTASSGTPPVLTRLLLGAPASCRLVYGPGCRYAGKMPALPAVIGVISEICG
jgi:hypothetical protein